MQEKVETRGALLMMKSQIQRLRFAFVDMAFNGRYLQWLTVGSLFRENKLEVSTLLKYLNKLSVLYPWPRLGQEMIVCKSRMIVVGNSESKDELEEGDEVEIRGKQRLRRWLK